MQLLVVTATGAFDPAEAKRRGLPVAIVGSVDRCNRPDAMLGPRSEPGAVIHDLDTLVARAIRIATESKLEAVDGTVLDVQADSLLLHGDNAGAVTTARAIRDGYLDIAIAGGAEAPIIASAVGVFQGTRAMSAPDPEDVARSCKPFAKNRSGLVLGEGAAMVVLPEMFVTGYQTQDLVLKAAFTRDAMAEIEKLAQDCADGPVIGIGGPYAEGKKLYNAFWILQHGKVVTRVLKHDLPTKQLFHGLPPFD